MFKEISNRPNHIIVLITVCSCRSVCSRLEYPTQILALSIQSKGLSNMLLKASAGEYAVLLVYLNSINMEKSTPHLEWDKVISYPLWCLWMKRQFMLMVCECSMPGVLFWKVNRSCWNTELFHSSWTGLDWQVYFHGKKIWHVSSKFMVSSVSHVILLLSLCSLG